MISTFLAASSCDRLSWRRLRLPPTASLDSVFRCFLSSLSQPFPVLGRMQSADFSSLFQLFGGEERWSREIKSLWCNIIQSFLVFFLLLFSRTFVLWVWASQQRHDLLLCSFSLSSFMRSHPWVVWCRYYFMCETLTLRAKRRLCGSSDLSLRLRWWKVLKRCLLRSWLHSLTREQTHHHTGRVEWWSGGRCPSSPSVEVTSAVWHQQVV